ncbi:MAG: CoA transferase [Flavobacteriales bacterium]|nr:CoA transferase [Flavobacteriales bacterium]
MKRLSELKIVELSSVLAGPSVGLFFSELGADVLKIENKKTQGDITRHWKLPNEDQNKKESAYYASVNFGKKTELLDLTDEEDHLKVIEYIKKCDIVLVNFKKGDEFKFNLDFNSLLKVNNRLIYGQLTGYGLEDDRVAFDMILQAECGYVSMCGTDHDHLAKMPVALIDVLAGHQLKEGVLCALLEGGPRHVHVSLYDTAIASLVNQASNYLNAGHVPRPLGTLHPNIAPYGDLFKSKDDKTFTLAIGSERQFEGLVKSFSIENAEPNLFTSNQLRVKNRAALNKILSETFTKYSYSQITEELSLQKIPHNLVKALDQVLNDPKAQRLIKDVTINSNPYRVTRSTVFEFIEHS